MEMCDVVCGQFVRRVKEQVDGCVHVEMVVIRFLFSAFFEKKECFLIIFIIIMIFLSFHFYFRFLLYCKSFFFSDSSTCVLHSASVPLFLMSSTFTDENKRSSSCT